MMHMTPSQEGDVKTLSNRSHFYTHALALAALVSLTGCPEIGDENQDANNNTIELVEGDTCERDDECSGELLCDEGTCTEACSEQAPCAGGDECVVDDDGRALCEPVEAPTTCADEDDPDAFCEAQQPGTSCQDRACVPVTANNMMEGGCQEDAECVSAGEGMICVDGMCEAGCRQDDACGEGEYCDLDLLECAAQCEDFDSCEIGEECAEVERGEDAPIMLCVERASCADAIDQDQFCEYELGVSGAACIDDICQAEAPEQLALAIQILDVSSDAACMETRADGLGSPGADIIAVELLDAQGSIIGYANALAHLAGEGPNDFTSSVHIDGTPQALDLQGCPEAIDDTRFRQDTVLSLGCGGDLIVEFLDPSGTPILLEDGMKIAVSEYAPICDIEDGDVEGQDRYGVFLCTVDEGMTQVTGDDCNFLLSEDPVGGYHEFEVLIL